MMKPPCNAAGAGPGLQPRTPLPTWISPPTMAGFFNRYFMFRPSPSLPAKVQRPSPVF